jgi:hypothetical protein
LTHAQVEALAEACARPTDVSKHRRLDERENQAYRLVVLFLLLPNADVVDLAAHKAKGKTAGQAPNSAGAPGEIRTRAPASGGRCSIP